MGPSRRPRPHPRPWASTPASSSPGPGSWAPGRASERGRGSGSPGSRWGTQTPEGQGQGRRGAQEGSPQATLARPRGPPARPGAQKAPPLVPAPPSFLRGDGEGREGGGPAPPGVPLRRGALTGRAWGVARPRGVPRTRLPRWLGAPHPAPPPDGEDPGRIRGGAPGLNPCAQGAAKTSEWSAAAGAGAQVGRAGGGAGRPGSRGARTGQGGGCLRPRAGRAAWCPGRGHLGTLEAPPAVRRGPAGADPRPSAPGGASGHRASPPAGGSWPPVPATGSVRVWPPGKGGGGGAEGAPFSDSLCLHLFIIYLPARPPLPAPRAPAPPHLLPGWPPPWTPTFYFCDPGPAWVPTARL